MQRPPETGKPEDMCALPRQRLGMRGEGEVSRKRIDGRPTGGGSYGLMSEEEGILAEQIGRK